MATIFTRSWWKSSYLSIMKNVTPNQLVVAVSLMVGAIAFSGMLLLGNIFESWFETPPTILSLLAFAALNAFVCYVLFYLAIEKFIYRKIKLIYKSIHQQKRPETEIVDKVDMNRNMIDEVENEVREWAEEKTLEINELKRMETYRREFLGNVSHELKTPVFNIIGYLETLQDGGINDENICIPYLTKAIQNVERLGTIINDLEEITRLESGELEIRKTNFVVYDLAQDVMDSLEYLASRKHISFLFKDGSERTEMVNADREKIHQVLTNLTTNAIRYGKDGGKIWVGIYDMDKRILIEVTDNGIGIAEKHLPRLFERFYRVDPSRTRGNGGSGLGLAIVKHIIEAHDQSIHVRSTEGVGTTIGFTLNKEIS